MQDHKPVVTLKIIFLNSTISQRFFSNKSAKKFHSYIRNSEQSIPEQIVGKN